MPTVRKALGDKIDLLVDANSAFSPKRAIEVGRLLEANGIGHFEEPCPYWELEQTRSVREALSLDVTGGEQDCYIPIWRHMIEMGAVDIVQPDVCYLGGLVRTLRVAAMAHAAGIPCTPHSANLSMVTLFTMHLLRAIPNAGKYLEFSIEGADYYPWQDGLFQQVALRRRRRARPSHGRAGAGGSRSIRHGSTSRSIRRARFRPDARGLRRTDGRSACNRYVVRLA